MERIGCMLAGYAILRAEFLLNADFVTAQDGVTVSLSRSRSEGELSERTCRCSCTALRAMVRPARPLSTCPTPRARLLPYKCVPALWE